MSRFYRVITLCGLVCLFFFVIPAHADTMYHVAGSATLVGNNACGASPCTEWVNFSFDLGWQFQPEFADPTYYAYATNLVVTWSGSLGPFAEERASQEIFSPYLYSSGPCTRTGNVNYLPLISPDFGQVDLYVCNDSVASPEYPWISSRGELYSCATAACITDFAVQVGYPVNFLTVEATVTRIPEPSTLTLLAFGLLALALAGAFSRKLQHKSSGRLVKSG